MSEENELQQAPTDERFKRILIYAGILIFVFLLGLIPMGFIARSRAQERDQARSELRKCMIESSLASATIDARLGYYEPARVAGSSFFTELRAELDKGNQSVFNQSQRENLNSLMSLRDELITLLARNDPAAADRLSTIFVTFRKALNPAAAQP